MSIIFDMFVPSRRHLEEEQNRLEWTRDEEGQGDPHRGPIDLDSGVVKIQPRGGDEVGEVDGVRGATDDVSESTDGVSGSAGR